MGFFFFSGISLLDCRSWSIIDFDMSEIPTLDDLYDKHPEIMGERPPIVICSKKISEISEKEDD